MDRKVNFLFFYLFVKFRAGVCQKTFEIKQKKNFAVNAIAFYQSFDSEWLIFAGIKDGTIEVFNSSSSTPLMVLKNHTQNGN